MKARTIAAAAIAAAIVFAAVGRPTLGRLRQGAQQIARRAALPPFRLATTLVPGQFNGRTFTDGGVTFRYQLFLPRGYDPAKRWPVLVALHGSAEKGSDGVQPLGVGVGKIVQAQSSTFPAVVLLPQVPMEGKILDWTPEFTRMIDSVVREVHGDPDRVYLTGISMGGILAYDMAMHTPGKYAALVTVSAPVVIQPTPDRASRFPSSQSHPALAKALGRTAVWIFQGAHDEAAPASEARHLVAALHEAHVPVTYTEYADGNHAVWDRAYETPALWSWLFAQHR
jgi:predicted peptidase